jgi:hypothetical protein
MQKNKGKNGNSMAEKTIWKLRGIKRRCKKGRCPCLREENAKHTPLKCSEMKSGDEFVHSKMVEHK